MVVRGRNIADSVKYWIKPDLKNRIKERSIVAYFDTVVEEILEDGGKVAAKPIRKAAAVAVIENPFAGRFVEDLQTLIKTGELPDVVYATVPAKCPKCGGVVQENYRKFQCQKCDFSLWKVTSGREWSPEEVAELITKRVIGPLTGFRSRMGKPFAAVMRLTDDLRLEFDFGQASGEAEQAPAQGEGCLHLKNVDHRHGRGACPKNGYALSSRNKGLGQEGVAT